MGVRGIVLKMMREDLTMRVASTTRDDRVEKDACRSYNWRTIVWWGFPKVLLVP